MKVKKKKIALPRRAWKINPVTRVKDSDKTFSRPRARQNFRKIQDEA